MLPAIVAILSVFISGIFAMRQIQKQYQNTIKQMREETVVLKHRKRHDRTLEALQRCWGLLVYTTDNENEQAIITYTVDKTEGKNVKTYYFHKSNINDFIANLRRFFYTDGWGLYLSKELKELLFSYERIIWGLKLPGETSPDDTQQIRNAKVAEKLFEIHRQLINVIKQDMKKIYDD
jgi:hypothetical protein